MSLSRAVLPGPVPGQVQDAIGRGGGQLAATTERADGLIWLGERASDLANVLADATGVRRVQLASAGVDGYLGLMADDDRT